MSRRDFRVEVKISQHSSARAINVVAKRDGRPLGGAYIVHAEGGRQGELVTLKVLEGERRVGVGAALLKTAEFVARRMGLKTVTTWMADPDSTEKFLEKRGYVVEGRSAAKNLG